MISRLYCCVSVTALVFASVMPISSALGFSCRQAERISEPARLLISACLKHSIITSTTLQGIDVQLVNLGDVNLTLIGSNPWNPFAVAIYNTTGHLLGVTGPHSPAPPWLANDLPAKASIAGSWAWGNNLGLEGLGAFYAAAFLTARVEWNNTKLFDEVFTPFIAYQVVDEISVPFGVYQVTVISLLGLNAVLIAILLTRLNRLIRLLTQPHPPREPWSERTELPKKE